MASCCERAHYGLDGLTNSSSFLLLVLFFTLPYFLRCCDHLMRGVALIDQI